MRPRKPKLPDLDIFAERFIAHALDVIGRDLDTFAQKQATAFRNVILADLRGSFQVPALKPETVEAKTRAGIENPGRPLVATSTYVRAIEVRNILTNDRHHRVIAIAIPPERVAVTYHHEARHDVPLAKVAFIHEFGSPKAHVPPRPHWRPFFERTLQPEAQRLIPTLAEKVVASWRPT